MARTTGKSARARGHDYEVAVANFISATTSHDAKTTRFKLRGAGGDIATREGDLWVPWVRDFAERRWSLECKSTDRFSPTPWTRQAFVNLDKDMGGDGRTCVVIDRFNRPTYESWVMAFYADQSYGPDPWAMFSLRQFLEVEMHRLE